jgi:hypothetical protein
MNKLASAEGTQAQGGDDSAGFSMSKAIRILIIVVVLALLVWPLLALGNFLTAKSVYQHFVDSLAEQLGWNQYLIKALVLVCLVPFFYAVKLFFSPLSKQRRRRGALLMTGMAVAYNLFFYFGTRDVAFGFGHREVLKYYARTDKGIIFYDRPGFDPTTGQGLKPVTPEVVRELSQLREGPLAKVDPARVAWFNPYTGGPELWYYRFPDGQLEFYNRPGMHPQTGEALSPVTKDLFLSWRGAGHEATQVSTNRSAATANAARGAKTDARMESFRRALVPGSGRGTMGLLMVGQDEAGQEGADVLARHLTMFNSNALRAATLQREGFGPELYAGDTDLLREAMAVTQLGSLVVAQVTVLCEKRSQIDSDLLSCDLTAKARKFDAHGNPAGSASARGTGAGFSRADALEEAAQRAKTGMTAFAGQ